MKNRIAFSLLFTIILTINSFAQKTKLLLPISWNVGDISTYQLKQRYLGGALGENYERTCSKSFQIKVIQINPKPKSGYLIEWKYLSYITPETDTLVESDCPIIIKKYLLQNPLVIQINEKGEYQNLIKKEEIKNKILAFVTKESAKLGDKYCIDATKNKIKLYTFDEYFDSLIPEIKTFFTAYSLFPCSINEEKIDTVEVVEDANQKVIKLPKTICSKPEVSHDQIKVTFDMKLSEPELKSYFSESMKLAWEQMGFKSTDSTMIDSYRKLEDFQPKNSVKMEAIFDKKGRLLSFDDFKDEKMQLKGGTSFYNYYRRLNNGKLPPKKH
jgi:hypothetical protein